MNSITLLIIGAPAVLAVIAFKLSQRQGPKDEPAESWPEEDWWESQDWQWPDRNWAHSRTGDR